MQVINGDVFTTYAPIKKKSAITNERQYLISLFVDELNKGRGKYPEVKPSGVAYRLCHMPTHDLQDFWNMCHNAKSFGKYFYWSLNPKKHETKN